MISFFTISNMSHEKLFFIPRRHFVFRLEEDDKLERIRIERERELESMRKARAMQLEEEVEDFS